MNANVMAGFCDLNRVADQQGFITVYPNGTGIRDLFLTWNAGGRNGWGGFNQTDDVTFIGKILDELPWMVNVDTRRVYATGMSNGAMMCYRLASELSDRIAAIAPVAGTLAIDKLCCRRPISVMHFHGTKDKLVPFEGPTGEAHRKFQFKSVPETIRQCIEANGCSKEAAEELLPDRAEDGMRVKKLAHNHGKKGAEVILFIVEGGGHTWPGEPAPQIIGPSTRDISANELIWEFFQRHRLE
jgi:polyhydroxybutyrate depolymerase